jgi:hypothetical protein
MATSYTDVKNRYLTPFRYRVSSVLASTRPILTTVGIAHRPYRTDTDRYKTDRLPSLLPINLQMHRLALTTMLLIVVRAESSTQGTQSPQITLIKDFPPYMDSAPCVKDAFTNCFGETCILESLHCADQDMLCVCHQFGPAMRDIASLAAISCENRTASMVLEAVATATSVMSEFCAQLSLASCDRPQTSMLIWCRYDIIRK